MKVQFDTYTAIGDRPENEDVGLAEKVSGELLYAVVADGLGGHEYGRTAADIAARHLGRCCAQGWLPDRAEILQHLEQANREMLETRENCNQLKTTVVFLAVGDGRAVWAHIGDSRLYHFFDGELADYTLDHSMCELAVRLGEITRAQIPTHADRGRLLRVLGEEEIEPEIHEVIRLQPGRHAFLLCTDGLWERLVESEIGLDLQKSAGPAEWLDCLRRRAARRKWTDVDNNTAVAVFVEI